MMKPLRELKLALPGRCSSLVTTRERGGLQFKYRWDCGCNATGLDDKALHVHACSSHHDIFAGAALTSNATVI
jgi:hypothetical protein